MLEVSELTKKYQKTVALNNVNLIAEPGQITVLLGPNGAGKSTLMKSIIGVLRYSGSISVFGHPNKSCTAKRLFGYVPETPMLYDLLTVNEHLEFMARAYGIKSYKERMNRYLDRFDLTEHRDKTAHEMSKGMRQKVSICCSLLPRPQMVLFDEPMIGLDPAAIRELKKIFIELKERGVVVLISTHIIDSIHDLWDHAYILHKGTVRRSINRDDPLEKEKELESIFFQETGTDGTLEPATDGAY
jgi:ABC-2 type transport system ATP-binding protein